MKFFACSECGGSPSSTPTRRNITCSDKYPSLASSTALKLLGVAKGGTCQTYLGSTLPGFVWLNAEGAAIVNREPELTLPEATDNEFSNLLVGAPNEDEDGEIVWQMFAAPENSNTYQLVCVDGLWKLSDIGSTPGLSILGTEGEFASPIVLIGIEEVTPGNWLARKLTADDQRVIVGTPDNTFKCLPPDEYLVHALANFGQARIGLFVHNDDGGIAEGEGISQGLADADSKLVVYNIDEKRFHQAPARVGDEIAAETQVHVTEGGAWVALDPHCITTQTFNYPKALVIATIRNSLDNNSDPVDPNDFSVDYGLFLDGAGSPIKVWDVKGTRDNTMHFLIENLTLGEHTLEIKARRDAVDMQNLYVELSNMSVASLP